MIYHNVLQKAFSSFMISGHPPQILCGAEETGIGASQVHNKGHTTKPLIKTVSSGSQLYALVRRHTVIKYSELQDIAHLWLCAPPRGVHVNARGVFPFGGLAKSPPLFRIYRIPTDNQLSIE